MTELTHTGQFIDSHRGEAARLLSAELGIDARSLSMALARRSHRPRPMDLSVIRAQQTIADRFTPLGLIAKPVPVRRSGVVRRTRAGRHQTADGGQLAKFARYLPDCSGADSLDLMAMLPLKTLRIGGICGCSSVNRRRVKSNPPHPRGAGFTLRRYLPACPEQLIVQQSAHPRSGGVVR